MTHNAQIHQADQQGGNIIGQLKSLTEKLKKDLRLPEVVTKDLIEALTAQRDQDQHNGQDTGTTVVETTTDNAWRDATLQSSSSALSSTPTINSVHTITQPTDPSRIQSYESITVDDTDTNAKPHANKHLQQTPTDLALDNLASRLDKHDFNTGYDAGQQHQDQRPHDDKEKENQYAACITKGILKQSRLTPQPQPFADTDNAIINSTIDLIMAKTTTNSRDKTINEKPSNSRHKYTSGFAYDESHS